MTNTRTRVEPLHCPEGDGSTLHPLQIVDHRVGAVCLTSSGRVVTVRRLSRLPGHAIVESGTSGVILSQCLPLAGLVVLAGAEVQP